MKSEKQIKKVFDEWDKYLTEAMKKYWVERRDNPDLDQHLENSRLHSQYWFARDVLRNIRAEIFELKNY